VRLNQGSNFEWSKLCASGRYSGAHKAHGLQENLGRALYLSVINLIVGKADRQGMDGAKEISAPMVNAASYWVLNNLHPIKSFNTDNWDAAFYRKGYGKYSMQEWRKDRV